MPKGSAPITSGQVKTFKDLRTWQKAMDLSLEVYNLTQCYPKHDFFGLVAESRKTVRSVPYNIAEGHRRATTPEFIRFLRIAAGSCGELETQLLLARRLGYFSEIPAKAVFETHAEVQRMLDALIRSLTRKLRS